MLQATMPGATDDEADLLRKEHRQALAQNALLAEQNATLTQENKLLREKVDLLIKRLFGAKSEKLSSEQLQLMLAGAEEPKKEPASCASSGALEAELHRKPRTASRLSKEREPRVPQDLPAVEQIVDPVEVQEAPERWRQIGQEITEQLDYEPGRYLRRRIIRRKYVRRDAPHLAPVIAELTTLQERSIAAPGLLAQIIVNKYCAHLPLYRQQAVCKMCHGLDIPRQSMARWMGLAANWLRPIYEQIQASIFEGGYVQIDETPVDYLSPGAGQTKQGYFWTCKQPGGDVFYHWSLSRSAATLEQIVPKDFTGIVQCDAYSAYGAFARRRGGRVELAGCMAHVRRYFWEAKDNAPTLACWVLIQMKHLYAIEQRLRQQRAGPRLRQALRAAEARPLLERLYKVLALKKAGGQYLPQSAMGQAIDYALEQWPLLEVYLQEGRVEIDNNLVENAIRPTAIGKKNWLFIGEADTGERSAILYTIIESCRRRGLDPFGYLREVLTRLPSMKVTQIHEVLPAAWAKAHATRLPKAA
jgi:transposase